MVDQAKLQEEVDKNYEAFLKELPKLRIAHEGKIALLRSKNVVQIFDTASDAMIYGRAEYDDGLFSIQEITSGDAVDMGYFSHAVHHDSV